MLLVIIAWLPLAAYAQVLSPLWTNYFNGQGNSNDYAYAMSLDGAGNIFVTGTSYGGGSLMDFVTIKYSNAGSPLWTNRFNGSASKDDIAYATTTDRNGNVIVTGASYAAFNSVDFVTIKYSNNGLPLWTNRFNGSGNTLQIPSFVVVDASNNVFVACAASSKYNTTKYSEAGVPIWTNTYSPGTVVALAVDGDGNILVTGGSHSPTSLSDCATIKYSNIGLPLWTNRFNGSGNNNDYGYAITADASGNVFVGGTTLSFGVGIADYATLKYDRDGLPLWTNLYDGPRHDNDAATSIAVNSMGEVIVSGRSPDTTNGFDFLTVKYSNTGTALWSNRYDGPGYSADIPYGMVLDGGDNVYVTGVCGGNETSYDYATVKYSSAGTPLWTNVFNGQGNDRDEARAIAVDRDGNVFVTGFSTNSTSGNDIVTIAYGLSLPSLSLKINFTTDNILRLTLSGQPGSSYVLESCTNLSLPFQWQSAYTNIADTNGVWQFIESNVNDTVRFYRAKTP